MPSKGNPILAKTRRQFVGRGRGKIELGEGWYSSLRKMI